MSTTHIQPLPNVYGRMAYTELGEGKKRTENIQNGTNRIAAQMGDGDSREEFVRFCSAMKRWHSTPHAGSRSTPTTPRSSARTTS